MKKPCIRNLDCFKKTGCPEKPWDGKEGCPAWKELIVSTRANPLEKEVRKQCMDEWLFEFAWAGLGISEGQQRVSEEIRNGLVSKADTGELIPKMNIVLQHMQQALIEG